MTLARAPWLHPDLIETSQLLWAHPTPRFGPANGYGFPSGVVR